MLAAVPSFVAAIVLLSVFAVKLGWLPGARQRLGLRRHDPAPDPAGDRPGRIGVGDRRAGDARDRARRARPGARPDGDQPRDPLAGWSSAATCCATPRSRSPPCVGITITSLFALSAVVEQAFNLNGIGAALVQAARQQGLRASSRGSRCCSSRAFVIANALVDLLYAVLDPRVADRSTGRMSVVAPATPLRPPRARRAPARSQQPSSTGCAGRSWGSPCSWRSSVRCWRRTIPTTGQLEFQFVGPFQAKGYLLGFDSQGRDLLSRLMVGARTSMLGPFARRRHVDGAGDDHRDRWPPGAAAGSTPALGTVHGHPLRVPRDPAGGPGGGGVRRRAGGADDRAGDRLHAVHRARPALGGGPRARA